MKNIKKARGVTNSTNMASPSPVDSFFATFTGLKSILYRNTSLLAVIMFPLTYQMVIVGFLIEEEASGVCNKTVNCIITFDSGDLRTNISASRISTEGKPPAPFKKELALGLVRYLCTLLGALVLGLIADTFGRLKALFPSLVIVFLGGLSSAFTFQNWVVFNILRGLAGFGIGGAIPIIFVLAAEYVSPNLRAIMILILWTSSTLALVTLAGIAYIIQNRESLMLTMTFPLLLAILLWRIVPESPRWAFLHSSTKDGTNEAQGLLERLVNEEQRQSSKYRNCLTMWGHFHFPAEARTRGRCFTFLRGKKQRKITIVLGLAWFAAGLLYNGLDTSSIQLLEDFYANYAVRELVNLLGFVLFLLLVTWTGRRVSTVISMMFAGAFCLIFSVSSVGFLKAERAAVVAVIQLTGRVCIQASQASLILYTIELFPTIVRCSAFGLIISIGYLGEALSPLVMMLQNITHPVVPLGVMGCFCLTAGLLCHCLLPKTKGTMAETFDDGSVMSRFQAAVWSPRVYRNQTKPDDESGIDNDTLAENAECNDEFEELRKSWEVSFDRVSRASPWEILSYEDAKTRPISYAAYQSLNEESHLLSEEDIDKLSDHVPSCTWVLAYSTFQHGMSLKTLYYRLREVDTPVLLVVKDDKGFVFGVLAPMAPRMDSNFCGAGKSFFFACRPQYKIYPCSGKNAYYMTGDTSGLAFGCSEGTFGLWLDNDLYRGRSTACETYNSEMLSSSEDFFCVGVEVWTFA